MLLQGNSSLTKRRISSTKALIRFKGRVKMTETFNKAEDQLREITECPICMSAFTDPRMLSCIHTFCFECLNRTGEVDQKKPGDKMPCPLCRKEFIIPADGMNGVQKNFFMENLLVYKVTLQFVGTTVICDMCNIRNKGKTGEIPKATMRCMECQDYYCEGCAEIHQFQKATKDHQMVNVGSDLTSETKRLVSIKPCTKHVHKPLDYYCFDCKKVVCVSCFVESHKLHDCKDVTTVDEEFRQVIEKEAWKISSYVKEMLHMRNSNEKKNSDFLKEIVEKEKEIRKRNQELKDMIDRHTEVLLDELSVIKSKQLKGMENQKEEIERCRVILESFEAYCTELTLKGSASDICSSVDQIILRADELERDHEAFISRPLQSVEVSFQAIDLAEVLQNAGSNFFGKVHVEETTSQYENFAVFVGFDDETTITNDVIKINIQTPNDIRTPDQIPTIMKKEAVADVCQNTMYVAGIGVKYDEIWKYSQTSGWLKCASLVQGRRRHSAAFIDEVLYICGGFVASTKLVLDTVEAYNAISNQCATVGKLVHGVQASSNCIPFRNSLYLFGGIDKDGNDVSHVQLYNTKESTCSLISKPMPRPYRLMRAVLWETSVILLGSYACFIFDIETEAWQDRKQFKTDVAHFGLVLENERVSVIGGGVWGKDKDGKDAWTYRDDICYVPLQNIIDDKPIDWRIHGKLPKPSLVHAYAKMRFLV